MLKSGDVAFVRPILHQSGKGQINDLVDLETLQSCEWYSVVLKS